MTDSKKEMLYSGKYINLIKVGTWEFVERSNSMEAAIIVPVYVDDQGDLNLVIIREYRIPLEGYIYGLPAGLVGDHGEEDTEVAASRELLEETGYSSDRLRYLTCGPATSGLSNEMLHFYLADKLKYVTSEVGVGDEDITVHVVPVNDVRSWLDDKKLSGDFIDPKIYLGLYFVSQEADLE